MNAALHYRLKSARYVTRINCPSSFTRSSFTAFITFKEVVFQLSLIVIRLLNLKVMNAVNEERVDEDGQFMRVTYLALFK